MTVRQFKLPVLLTNLIILLSFQAGMGREFNEDSLNQTFSERTFGIGQLFALRIIDYYQNQINPKSISRCPFDLSCSNYTAFSIQRYGFWGGAIRFIDRSQFREHQYSSLYYPLAVNSDGLLKLDDGYYCNAETAFHSSIPIAKPDKAVNPPSRIGWADQLFREGDYARAITVYKEVRYFNNDDELKGYCSYQIARCHLGLRQYDKLAIRISQYFSRDDLTSEQSSRATQLMGLAYAMQKLTPLAEMQFDRAFSLHNNSLTDIYLAWMVAEQGDWRLAQDRFSNSAKVYADRGSTATRLSEWASLMGQAEHIPRKSALTAGLMSTLFPGSGQIYCGHTVDAIQAFVYVTGFGLATWAAYRYESSFHQARIGTYVGSMFTLSFHIANIWGAQRTAKYRNNRYYEEILNPIRKRAIQLEFDLPAP